MELDHYDTINSPTEGIYKEKGSKFISYAYPCRSIEEHKASIESLRALHPKSRHICYAYRIGLTGAEFRMNDDGEPSGTAGRPIHNEILSCGLSDILVAVVRYFGGTKLGATGLIRAYKAAAVDSLSDISRVTRYISEQRIITYPIDIMGRLYEVLKSENVEIMESVFEPKPHLLISYRKSQIDKKMLAITAKIHGYATDQINDDFKSDLITIKPAV